MFVESSAVAAEKISTNAIATDSFFVVVSPKWFLLFSSELVFKTVYVHPQSVGYSGLLFIKPFEVPIEVRATILGRTRQTRELFSRIINYVH